MKTDERFWDCECEHNYIHNKQEQQHCGKCGADMDEQPDSHYSEVVEQIGS